ncbi:spore gernimation protein [Paenibacillus mesophilus]|uniref:GerAB/ArcD/ProY family transporter n=1 Tax=Paenibacillus mesophilus TaxID=2582849 RepID=UPI00110F29AB|nr:endospore germination permease [Paenibacillus mesophilus]TMV50908.1 spore gernimation protein [Paenibacillus mesophilus]
MQPNKKISVLLLYMTIILSIGISNHVLLIPVLLETARRDAWVGATAAIVPMIAWVGVLHLIIRRIGHRQVGEWLQERYGKAVRLIVAALAIVYLSVSAFTSLDDMVMWTHVSYLPRTPRFVIALAFVVVCFFAARAGMRAIAITSGLLLPGVVVLGYFVASANLQYKDYSLLTPVFTHGYVPAIKAMAYTGGGLFELVLILFMQHHVKSAIRTRSLLVMALILVGLTVGPVTGSIALFGPFEAAEQRYPAFEQWRMVTMGKFISHLDFFSIYQWISGSFIRVSLMLFLIPDAAGMKNRRSRNFLLAGLSIALLAATMLPVSDPTLLYFLSRWYFPGISGLNMWFGLMLLVLTLLPAARGKENARS